MLHLDAAVVEVVFETDFSLPAFFVNVLG